MNEKTVVIDRVSDMPRRRDEQSSHEEHPGFKTASLVARIVLGAVMLIAGAEKLGALEAFGANIYNYQLLPVELVNVAALLFVWAEIAVGVMLIAGAAVRGSALVSSVMLALFIVAIGSAMARGLKIDCGCFVGKKAATTATVDATALNRGAVYDSTVIASGSAPTAANTNTESPAPDEPAKVGWPKIFEDLGLLALAIFLVYYPRSYLSVDQVLRREDLSSDDLLVHREVAIRADAPRGRSL